MLSRVVLFVSLASFATGCLASTIADNVQKGVAESNRHKEREQELAIKAKEADAKNAEAKNAPAAAPKSDAK